MLCWLCEGSTAGWALSQTLPFPPLSNETSRVGRKLLVVSELQDQPEPELPGAGGSQEQVGARSRWGAAPKGSVLGDALLCRKPPQNIAA